MLIGVLVSGICFGVVTNKVIKNKGYEENWFWWGFFFGVFALVVACTKPSNVVVTGALQSPGVVSYMPPNINSENYDTLFSTPEKQYSRGCPVIVKSGTLLKERATGKTFAKCDFQIVTSKKIKGVFISVLEYDVAGDYLGKTDTQYLDLDRISGILFGSDNAIALSNNFTRKIEVRCTKVIFEDDTRWDTEGNLIQLPSSVYLSRSLGPELEKQYKLEVNDKAVFHPVKLEELWICSCGSVNIQSNSNCVNCNAKKEQVFASLDREKLQRKADIRSIKEQAEEEKAKKKIRKRNKWLLIWCPIIILACILIFTIVDYNTLQVELVAFNTISDNNDLISTSIPKSEDYLHFAFKFKGPQEYTLRHSAQWPGEDAKLSDWVWEDVKAGDICGAEWENGYSKKRGTLVIEILDDKTGEILGRFEMEIK